MRPGPFIASSATGVTSRRCRDAENPAEPLDRVARTLPRDEFLARMLLGVRGTPEIGLANPLTPYEIGAIRRFLVRGTIAEGGD